MSHLVIAAVAVLAFALNYLALQERDATVLVAVADRHLPAGVPVGVEDVRFVAVPSDFAGLPSLVTEDELASRGGWVLGRAIPGDGVIGEEALVKPGAPDGLRAMSIPIEVEHAAGGSLMAGDRVDVIATTDGEAVFVVTDVEVISVADTSAAAFGAIGSYHVVVAVDADQALHLASAIANGAIEILRSTGAEPIARAGD
jgi:Flp pilus assembly protein CpaB